MTITVRGEYGLEGRTNASGQYDFTFVWSGWLKSDGEDYLLLHERCDLVKWEAEERSNGPDGILLLTTNDFDERPELKVNYLLKTGKGLLLDFLIQGFEVPRSVPRDAFYLHFPASAENGSHEAGLQYNLFITKGSNSIILNDAALKKGGEEKKFSWTWRYRTGVQKKNQILFMTNRHEAEATLVVTPQK